MRPTAQQIKEWRAQFKMSQERLAKWLGVHRRSVESWEYETYTAPAWAWQKMMEYQP